MVHLIVRLFVLILLWILLPLKFQAPMIILKLVESMIFFRLLQGGLDLLHTLILPEHGQFLIPPLLLLQVHQLCLQMRVYLFKLKLPEVVMMKQVLTTELRQ